MDERNAWDRFWSYDRLASFGTGSGSGNYGPAIADGWHAFFAALPAGSRVLDIATGNGAIAVMAVEAGHRLRVTGIDLAQVRPAAFVTGKRGALNAVQFLGGTPAEELPLESGAVDAVVSQYGIEYSDLERSLPQAARVLAPGGRLRFASHAAEGNVVAETRKAIGEANDLLHADLIGKSERCFRAIRDIEEGRSSGPAAQAVAQGHYAGFREALRDIAERTPKAADPSMLASVHESLTELFQQRQAHDLPSLLHRIAALGEEITAHLERQKALLAAARSAEQMQAVADRLASLELTDIEIGEQRDGGSLIGHVIEARRPL